MALLLRAISVWVNDCCSIGLEPISILARALFTSANDVSGGGGVEDDDAIEDVTSSGNGTDLDVFKSCSLLFSGETKLWIKCLSGLVRFTSKILSSSSSLLSEILNLVAISEEVEGSDTGTLSGLCTISTSLATSAGVSVSIFWTVSISDILSCVPLSPSFVSSTPSLVSLTSPQTSGSSASFSDLTSSTFSPSSLEDGVLWVKRSLFRHFALLFWNQTL